MNHAEASLKGAISLETTDECFSSQNLENLNKSPRMLMFSMKRKLYSPIILFSTMTAFCMITFRVGKLQKSDPLYFIHGPNHYMQVVVQFLETHDTNFLIFFSRLTSKALLREGLELFTYTPLVLESGLFNARSYIPPPNNSPSQFVSSSDISKITWRLFMHTKSCISINQ